MVKASQQQPKLAIEAEKEITKPKEEITDPALKRLSELTIELKDRYGSTERLADLLDATGAAIAKWMNGEIIGLQNIRVGNLRRLAEIKGWTLDYLLHYLEGTTSSGLPSGTSTPQIVTEGFNLASLSFKEKLRLNLELAKLLAETQEMNNLDENEELNLGKFERLRLGKLIEGSLAHPKGLKLIANLSQATGLNKGLLESLADAIDDVVITRKTLNLIAPHCFKPSTWEGTRPLRFLEERFHNSEDLLAALLNGNGVK